MEAYKQSILAAMQLMTIINNMWAEVGEIPHMQVHRTCYIIIYDHSSSKLEILSKYVIQYTPLVFRTIDDARKSLQEDRELWLQFLMIN